MRSASGASHHDLRPHDYESFATMATVASADLMMDSRRYRWLTTWGEWFFRQRSWTPIPFMLILVLVSWHESRDRFTWMPGLMLLALGEGLRLWGVAVIGKESRTRGSGVKQLVDSGPYAYVRNPLYVGNLLLTLGAACISELLWMIPIVLILFMAQYVPIVLWEEGILAERFGQVYADYCRRVPRWWPRRPSQQRKTPSYQWRAACWSERSTLGTLVLLLVIMMAKENLHHLPKYFHKHPMTLPINSTTLP